MDAGSGYILRVRLVVWHSRCDVLGCVVEKPTPQTRTELIDSTRQQSESLTDFLFSRETRRKKERSAATNMVLQRGFVCADLY